MTEHVHRYGDPRVFVFGSNLRGIHGAGAALYARKYLGALQCIGEGLMPCASSPGCYALPTCYEPGRAVTLYELSHYVRNFLTVAGTRPDLRFFVSAVGCGLAGYHDFDVAPFFQAAPANCDLPPGWREFSQPRGRLL